MDLGGSHNFVAALSEIKIDSLRRCIRESQTRVFLLKWQGNKIPRGAQILGHTIAWTQHGIVRNKDGKQIGTYDRLVEFGGDSSREQWMLIFADPPHVVIEI